MHTVPPPIKYPYNPTEALDDIPGIKHAFDLFIASQMLEAEEYCNQSDEKKSFFTILLLFIFSYFIVHLLENGCILQQFMD